MVEHASGTFSRETAEAGLRAAFDGVGRTYWAYAFHEIGKVGWGVKEQVGHWRELKRRLGKGKWRVRGKGMVEFGVAYDGFGTDSKENVDLVVALIK